MLGFLAIDKAICLRLEVDIIEPEAQLYNPTPGSPYEPAHSDALSPVEQPGTPQPYHLGNTTNRAGNVFRHSIPMAAFSVCPTLKTTHKSRELLHSEVYEAHFY